mmetsp:Transcript_1618/g.3305  ORF Transcript_1618/g.3305 Transcript_1618/m.3305 type:complete len:127 (+) Transcript_1618:1353-1733(+)
MVYSFSYNNTAERKHFIPSTTAFVYANVCECGQGGKSAKCKCEQHVSVSSLWQRRERGWKDREGEGRKVRRGWKRKSGMKNVEEKRRGEMETSVCTTVTLSLYTHCPSTAPALYSKRKEQRKKKVG